MQDLPKGLDKIADRVRTVDVSNNMLDSLPASLSPLSKIERLLAANNNISSILCDMTTWSKLKVCCLQYCCTTNDHCHMHPVNDCTQCKPRPTSTYANLSRMRFRWL